MTIQQLERSQKTYIEIKKLDAEIIEIEKIAQLIANGDADVSFTLKVKDTTVKEEVENKAVEGDGIVNLGTLEFNPFAGFISSLNAMKYPKADKIDASNDIILNANLSENLSFNILAILLHDKQTKRTKLINSLKKLGVQLT